MFPVAEGVPFGNAVLNTFGAFTVSDNGTLAYQTGGTTLRRELVWVDRSGNRLDTATKPAEIQNPYSVSPDGKMLAMRIAPGLRSSGDLWLQDLTRGMLSRVTFRGALDSFPIWSPDGTRIVFSRAAGGGYLYDLFQKLATGSENEESLFDSGPSFVFATDWSTDGRFIAYTAQVAQTSFDLWILPLIGERKPSVYLQTPFNERDGQFLPNAGDGQRWMAFQSNESGRDQIYIQAVPASGAKIPDLDGGRHHSALAARRPRALLHLGRSAARRRPDFCRLRASSRQAAAAVCQRGDEFVRAVEKR